MPTQGESLIKKTQKGLSILAFETTKQSRILKKRMRIAALQKETKADLRDLGNLVYNSIINEQPGIIEEEEVQILVENIRVNKAEVERLRDAIARLSRAKKHFVEEEIEEAPAQYASPQTAAEGQVTAEEPTLEPTLEATGEEPTLGPKPGATEPAPAPHPAEPDEMGVSPTTPPAEEKPDEKPAEKAPAPRGPGADPDQPEATATEPEKKPEQQEG